MSLIINHNLMAMNAARNLDQTYGNLAVSVRRLSSGLRIGSAADDAAGLAIREMMRAEITSLQQGMRNVNDAVSMIQTADGALQIIDEKLTRMKELATQAATGTYNSDQRQMIDSEYQAMASEITRIAQATDFNGIHLLNGNLFGTHSGSGIHSTGAMKIHFGAGNDCAEDYYYVQIGCCTASALGVGFYQNVSVQEQTYAYFEQLRDAAGVAAYNATYSSEYESSYNIMYTKQISDGLPPEAASHAADLYAQNIAQPKAASDQETIKASLDDVYADQYGTTYSSSYTNYLSQGMSTAEAAAQADKDAAAAGIEATLVEAENFVNGTPTEMPLQNIDGAQDYRDAASNAAYTYSYSTIYDAEFAAEYNAAYAAQPVGAKDPIAAVNTAHAIVHPVADAAGNQNGQAVSDDLKDIYDLNWVPAYNNEYAAQIAAGHTVEEAQALATEAANTAGWAAMETEKTAMAGGGATYIPGTYPLDLHGGTLTEANVLSETASGIQQFLDNHGVFDASSITGAGATYLDEHVYENVSLGTGAYTISTQEAAQNALGAIDNAIISKDKIRAHLGALQNRLENTVTNLATQAENLQSAESQISDTDVATEMTEYVRQQIKAQAAVAMLAQANSLPQMAMQLIGG